MTSWFLFLFFFSNREDSHSDGRLACGVHLEFLTASGTVRLNFETRKPFFLLTYERWN